MVCKYCMCVVDYWQYSVLGTDMGSITLKSNILLLLQNYLYYYYYYMSMLYQCNILYCYYFWSFSITITKERSVQSWKKPLTTWQVELKNFLSAADTDFNQLNAYMYRMFSMGTKQNVTMS